MASPVGTGRANVSSGPDFGLFPSLYREMNGNNRKVRGTNYSTGGFQRVTRFAPQVKVRVVGFITVVAAGSLLLAWITSSLWKQLDHLQKDYAATKSQTFYMGVHFRGSIRALNEKLLQFGTSTDPTLRDTFRNDSTELKSWIHTNLVVLAEMAKLELLKNVDVGRQTALLNQIATNYDAYLTNALSVFTATNKVVEPGSFETLYQRVREISSPLFPLADDLVLAQREGFSEFLRGTQETLLDHQRLLMVCSAIILGLAGISALLVYRGMIAPLKVGLSESTSIIERQEKLASLGVLASGVAHEIRNPLTAIKFRLFSLRKAVPAVAQNEDVSVIGSEINRLEEIVQDFLQFARPSEPNLTRTSPARVLEEVRDLLRPQMEKAGIELKLDKAAPVTVYADAQQLKQVLINLIQNASESIGRNGAISLGVRRGTAELDGRTRTAAIVSVADTGKGMTPEIEARLFDPFFTTKEEGTGLGLAISARIVEKHGGLLRYDTAVDSGTTFEIVLPALEHHAS